MPWLVHIPPMGMSVPASPEFTPPVEPLLHFVHRDYPGRGFLRGGINNGEPAVRELVPTKVRIPKSRTNFYPDFLAFGSIWAVSEPFRAKVEELEPGVHEFFPLALSTKGGQPIAKKYYLMNILNRVDAIDRDRSKLRYAARVDKYFTSGTGDIDPSIVIDEKEVAGMCMWYDEKIPEGIFISDELAKFVRAAELKRLDFFEAHVA